MAEQAVVGFGDRLHIQDDCVLIDGWWHAAFRVAPQTFALRDEEPPDGATFRADMAARLATAGLSEVPADPSLLTVITYTTVDLAGLDWRIWSTDLATADADMAARAGRDAFFGDEFARGPMGPSFVASMGGLRRTAGLKPLVLLAVGVDDGVAQALAGALGNCEVEVRPLFTVPEDCHSLTPNLVLVDCTSPDGEEFISRFRKAETDLLVPVVALSRGFPEGAFLALDPDAKPSEWAVHLQNLLP